MPKLSLELNPSSCFFFKWQFCCFKTCHTIQCSKAYLNLFWLVASPRIEYQQLSFNKFSLSLTRYIPKNCSSSFFIYNIRCKVQEKKIKIGFQWKISSKKIKNLFLKCKSKYLCCGWENKILGLYLCYLQNRKSQQIMTEYPQKN